MSIFFTLYVAFSLSRQNFAHGACIPTEESLLFIQMKAEAKFPAAFVERRTVIGDAETPTTQSPLEDLPIVEQDLFPTQAPDPLPQSCDAQECELVPVPADQIDKHLIVGGHNLPPSLRGLFFMDGNRLPDEVFSFAGVGHSVKNKDGTITISSEVYAPMVASFAGSEGALFYQTSVAMGARYVGTCEMKDDGDIKFCQLMPAFGGGEFPVPPGPIFDWKLIPTSDSLGEAGGINLKRPSVTFGIEGPFVMRRIVDEDGNRLHKNWNYYLSKVSERAPMQFVAKGTGRPPKAFNPMGLLRAVGQGKPSDALGWFTQVLSMLFDESTYVKRRAIPTHDVYESKLLHDAMCPLESIFQSMVAAEQIGGSAGAAEVIVQTIRARIWKRASVAQGNAPVNPLNDPVLQSDGPVAGLTWKQLSDYLLFLVSIPLSVKGAGSNRTLLYMNTAKATCWEPTVFANGLLRFKYFQVAEVLSDPRQLRGYATANVEQHPAFLTRDNAIFLSTGESQHTDLRLVWERIGFARKYPVPMTLIQHANWNVMEKSSVSELLVAQLSVPVIVQMMLGVTPPADIIKALMGYAIFGKFTVFGRIMHDFRLEPTGVADKIMLVRKGLLQWASSQTYVVKMLQDEVVQEYIAKYPGRGKEPVKLAASEEEHFLLGVTDLIMFAGVLGSTDMTTKCVQVIADDPDLRDSFEDDPERFLIELMRFDSAVTTVTSLLSDNQKMLVNGVRVRMKKGSPIMSSIATANRDQTTFRNPNILDSSRHNLGRVLSWNGEAQYVEQRDYTRAPRHCPGYCLSLKASAAMCAKFIGSFDSMAAAGKIGGPVECTNFAPKQDCRGMWSEFTPCSRTCDGGFRTKTFRVTRPARNGGARCQVKDGAKATEKCNRQVCPTTCLETNADGNCAKLTLAGEKALCPAELANLASVLKKLAELVYVNGLVLDDYIKHGTTGDDTIDSILEKIGGVEMILFLQQQFGACKETKPRQWLYEGGEERRKFFKTEGKA